MTTYETSTFASELSIAGDDDMHLQLLTRESTDMMTDFMADEENREYLKEFQPWVVTMNRETVSRTIAGRLADMRRNMSMQYLVAERDVMVGSVMLYSHIDTTARLGYYIGKNYAGRGYATRASQAVIEYATQPDVWGLDYFQLCISDQNDPSQGVARKLGANPTDYFSSEPTANPEQYRALRVWEKRL